MNAGGLLGFSLIDLRGILCSVQFEAFLQDGVGRPTKAIGLVRRAISVNELIKLLNVLSNRVP